MPLARDMLMDNDGLETRERLSVYASFIII